MPVVRAVRLALVLLLALGASGCARLFHAYDVAPSGLQRDDDALRRLLAAGQAELALKRLTPERDAPSDDLLRHLYLASAAHYAGDYHRSNAHLHAAAELADDRSTKSISRNALSLVSSDRVLPWEPGRTERLLVHYYGALNYLRLGELDGAVVEARRLAFLLQRFEEDMSPAEQPLHAALREISGAIFEAAGEGNDADVAYRNADALGRAAERGVPEGGGVVFVIIEHGFVAHRVESSLNVLLHGDEVAALTGGDAGEKAAMAGFVAARILAHAAFEADRWGEPGRARSGALVVPAPERPAVRKLRKACDDGAECADSTRDESPYLLRAAWPTFRQDGRAAPALRLAVTPVAALAADADAADRAALAAALNEASARRGGERSPPLLAQQPTGVREVVWTPPGADSLDPTAVAPAALGPLHFADVSRAVIADFERVRAAVIARTVARGAAKLAITRGAERAVADKDETAGRIVGILGNAGTALLEQADTRSWHLLPAGVAVVRVPLPAGVHRVVLESDGAGRAVDLGTVTVEAGRVLILNRRRW